MADADQLTTFKTELKGLLTSLAVCLMLFGLPDGLQAGLGEFRAWQTSQFCPCGLQKEFHPQEAHAPTCTG